MNRVRIALVAVALTGLSARARAISGSMEESKAELSDASGQYHMQIDIADRDTRSSRGLDCAPMSSSHATIAVPILVPELKRYPSDFFRKVGIKRMVLCGELHRDGKEWGGWAEPGTGTFYLSLAGANVDSGHAAHNFHHEVFHLVDKMNDREWGAIGGGYITDYARTNAREDRAELYGQLMVNPGEVSRQAADDPKLARKVQILESWVDAHVPALSGELHGH